MSEPQPDRSAAISAPKAGFSWPVALGGLLVVVPLLLVLGWGFRMDPHEMPSMLVEKPAPAFELKRYDTGEEIDLASLRGKPVLINFWATWCVSCRTEHPLLVQAERVYGDKVQFLGIAYQDRSEKIDRWLKQHGGSTFPTLVDVGNKVSTAYGVYAVPESFLIDSNGTIVFKKTGPLTPDDLRTQLARVQ